MYIMYQVDVLVFRKNNRTDQYELFSYWRAKVQLRIEKSQLVVQYNFISA